VPTYDYQCRSCGSVTEVIHSMLEDGPTTCERCGGELRRVLYPTGIIFKGSGFYSTDSKSGSSKAIAGSSPTSASSTVSGADGGGASGSSAGSTSSTTGSETKAATDPKPAAAAD